MGPRPEGRGRSIAPWVEKFKDMLQWGHGPKAVDGRTSAARMRPLSGFNGATARRPWTVGSSPWRASQLRSSFNGATARRPWTVADGPCQGGGHDASMGPRPEGRGRVVRPHTLVVRAMASMGPRPEGRGRRLMSAKLACLATLQWGHGPKAVDGAMHAEVVPPMSELQWGHGPKAVDGRLDGAESSHASRLQWGHGPKAVDGYALAPLPAL